MNSEYHVRRVGRVYEVAKFDWSKRPAVVYHLRAGRGCDCPAREACKHQDLVRVFRELGEPWMCTFFYDGSKWRWHTMK